MCSSKNNLIISIQPKQNIRFRYVSELGSSHGSLTGQHELNEIPNRKAVYPTVKLLLPKSVDDNKNKREFYVLCSLHNFEVNCLSPHVLMPKENVSINYEFIFQRMSENILNPLERSWELKEYIIVQLKSDVFQSALESKCEELQKLNLPMSFEQIKGNVNLNDVKSVKTSGSLNVCLGFTIFEKIQDTFCLYNETIYSNNIYGGNNLKIHQLCNKHGSINGGEEINILIKLNSKLPHHVLITKMNKELTEIEWSKEIKIEKKNIHRNHAIAFTLPPYDGPSCSDDEIEVGIQVLVSGTAYKSDTVIFHYINENLPRKQARKSNTFPQGEKDVASPILLDNSNDTITPTSNPNMQIENQNYENNFYDPYEWLETLKTISDDLNVNGLTELGDLSDIFPESNSYISRDQILSLHKKGIASKPAQLEYPSYKIKNKIDQILKMPDGKQYIDIRGVTEIDGNTIFHEALAIPHCFMHLYKMANNSPHRKLIVKAHNKYRENLLHYSCRKNRATCIRPLVGMGCRLNEQDCKGRTPLHIAMAYNHTDCILKIQQLLEDHSDYPKEVAKNLSGMLTVYNQRGHTVLHAAAIDNRVELLQIMLKFCQKYNINVKEYNVIGNADSLVHLIVKHNLIAMIKFIRHYLSYNLKIENYFLKFMLTYWFWLYRLQPQISYRH